MLFQSFKCRKCGNLLLYFVKLKDTSYIIINRQPILLMQNKNIQTIMPHELMHKWLRHFHK